jgi:hypothetical protein
MTVKAADMAAMAKQAAEKRAEATSEALWNVGAIRATNKIL